MLKNSIPVLATSLVVGSFVVIIPSSLSFLNTWYSVCESSYQLHIMRTEERENRVRACLLARQCIDFCGRQDGGQRAFSKRYRHRTRKLRTRENAFHKIEGTPSFSSLRLSRLTGAPTRGKTARHSYLIKSFRKILYTFKRQDQMNKNKTPDRFQIQVQKAFVTPVYKFL